MTERKRKEIGVDLLGANAMDPYFENSSGPRKAMFSTQIGQAPVVDGNTPRRIFTGVETQYAEDTFDVHLPCDATILKVIRKYPVGMGGDAIRHNPSTVIIYEDYYDPHKTIGVLEVNDFLSLHMEFGFELKKNPEVWNELAPGAMMEKGTRLAQSPAVRKNGQYGLGLEAEVAFMAMPGTIEDGFVVSKSFLNRMTPRTYSSSVGNWGRKTFPLNLYGDENHYKPFPDIGDTIRSDGLVFALRDIDDDMGVAEMTQRALREVDYAFDRPFFGKPGAKVVDVMVYHDDRLNPSSTPVGMDTQARKYYDALVIYYQSLVDEYQRLLKRRGNSLRITPEFNRLLVEAQMFLPVGGDRRKLTRMYRLEQLDEWRVEVTYEKQLDANMGYKFTDMHGGKGVVCKIMEDEDMPVDEHGNRCDVVIYGVSTVKRMNFGRFYEQFINAASRDLLHKLRQQAGLQPTIKPTSYQVAQLKDNEALIDTLWGQLMRFYDIVAPLQHDLLIDDPDHWRHVAAVLEDLGTWHDGIYLWIPPDNPVNNLEMAKALKESEFCPHYGPVSYKNNAGEMVTTVDPVLIGSLYMIMLEKTGEDWSGVASVKTNHFGVPAKLNNYDKQTSPGRQAPVRALGESETRSYISTVGAQATMELLDQSNNHATHCNAIHNILKAPHPTDIAKVVDREKVPFGGSRPVALVRHVLNCRGIKFVYRPDNALDETSTL